jgi:NAD(P)H-dependent flavin oxidoreductase YrpB (nitropropane dioxygenase family)
MAKQGHDNPVGINLLEKIQLWTPATLYGAMLAGVDAVLVGAGLPTHIPRLLDDYANGRPVSLPIDVAGSESSDELVISLTPHEVVPPAPQTLPRPVFLAIISSHILGAYLARDDSTRPDGFVVEGPTAGGHNAPPRRMELDESGEPIYGERDVVDLDKLAKVGLPYWLAGGQASPKHVVAARAAGAQGVQIGTVFALCHESGLSEPLRTALRVSLDAGTAEVRTDPRASPTGFPFKVVQMAGTVADPAVSTKRERICDLGYLRTPYRRDDGTIGQRCPAEPIDAYVRKGGVVEDTEGRKCLCNGLMSSAGVPQIRPDGGAEPPLLTLGQDLEAVHALLEMFPDGWSAADVMQWLLSDLDASGANGSSG